MSRLKSPFLVADGENALSPEYEIMFSLLVPMQAPNSFWFNFHDATFNDRRLFREANSSASFVSCFHFVPFNVALIDQFYRNF